MPRGGIVKKTNQSRKWFKTKQIAIQKKEPNLKTNFKNQMTREEIKNKIKLEIINVN
jgi:hypothetical protein